MITYQMFDHAARLRSIEIAHEILGIERYVGGSYRWGLRSEPLMHDLITIDGSFGEGGGQILRSSLALAAITRRPFRIQKIRANRPKPGLARQHLTAVTAAAEICSAQVEGAEIGARELTFRPGEVKAGDYRFDVGSAGSTTLVFQTVLPPLMIAGAPSTITLEGGTHNIHAPPVDFLEHAFLPLVNRMGPKVEVAVERAGFYPAGGGRVVATIEPAQKLNGIDLNHRGATVRHWATAVVAGLPADIARRELDVIRKGKKWPAEDFQIVELSPDQGPGNVVSIELRHEHVNEVFTGFGQRGVRAEAVADSALKEAQAYLATEAPVGEHLADQLVLPLALAGGGSFTTHVLSDHTTTNIEVVKRFLEVKVSVEQSGKKTWTVRFGG
jgi:RNA 3'-terminal phosphate cyclase (ATP)